MAGYTLLAVRGVLAEHEDEENPAAARVIPSGQLLYHALKQVSKLLLIIDQPEADRVAWCPRSHAFHDHAGVLVNPRSDAPVEGRGAVLTEAKQKGSVDLVVEGSPELAARSLNSGAVTLLVSIPLYTLSEFRPGDPPAGRPWTSLLEELDEQSSIRANDPRVTADIAGTRYDD